jgi:ornithine cyclodeaminase/alanine dehydrogenase-like protein (mu-crystallin family)
MDEILWLSDEDIKKTGVCRIENTVGIVDEIFRLFEDKKAKIVPESALRLEVNGQDQAFYSLPAYVGGPYGVCGVKWTAHGKPITDNATQSRIQAALVLNDAESGRPIAMMNGTEIGAARTAAVTAIALKHLAPLQTGKIALCGAGGQAEHQLQAILYSFPEAKKVAIWSRGHTKAEKLVGCYQNTTGVCLSSAETIEEAVEGADVIIGATSASEPYLMPTHFRDVSLYCHIGFNEITEAAINQFSAIVVDTWEEAKEVSGQSLFRIYREGKLQENRITGCLGAMLSGQLKISRGSLEKKVMFDAFGLPIFDIGVAKAAYMSAKAENIGCNMLWQ